MTEAVIENTTPEAAAAPATAAAPAPAAATPAAPAAPAAQAPAVPAPSLLAKGGAASPAQPPADAPASPIPAKYHVKKDDGTLDVEASLAKWGDGHKNLEQRLGSGEAPPAKPEDYAPTLPDGLSMDQLKNDPLFSSFLKGAHSLGLNNKQVGYVIEAYQQRLAMSNSPEVAEAELRKTWATDDQLQRGLSDSYRAAQAFANGDKDLAARVERKFGNDPDFIRLMAAVGRELHEDAPPAGTLSTVEMGSLESLMASEAYMQAKHPDHAKVVAQVNMLYAKRYPDR